MKTIVDFNEILQAKEREVFKAKKEFRTKSVDTLTYFNMDSYVNDYKLRNSYQCVRNLDFRFETEEKLQTFQDYLHIRDIVLRPRGSIKEKPRPSFPHNESYRNTRNPIHYCKGDVLVFVNASIYDKVRKSIDQYVLDVAYDGYWATIHSVDGGTPMELRKYIIRKNPKGVLFVGALPVAWYEMDDDFYGSHSEFPCDLFYMDTNARWHDPDHDGKYSNVIGAIKPEIWVGRIWTPISNGNNVKLINDYFKRNHKFRLGQLGHCYSSMAYVDDDWQGFDDCEMDQMFPSSQITKYTNPNTTDADLYKAEVNSLRSWVQLCAHSSPHLHALHVPSAGSNEYIDYTYFKDINAPNAHFYNLFCCGPGSFTTNNYLAGWYVYDKKGGGRNNGLTAVASAKSGSMLMFADFYRPMGQGKEIGEAFVEWWKARGSYHDLGERRWYYGLTLLGDPTLTWWKGCVPQKIEPHDNDVFDHYPRKTNFRWNPLDGLTNVKYDLEVDAFHAINAGQWAEETGQTFLLYTNRPGNSLIYYFVGMQPGRWRVRARVDGKVCAWSRWSYFEYKI